MRPPRLTPLKVAAKPTMRSPVSRPHTYVGMGKKQSMKKYGVEMLPSRHALSQLTGGDPIQRSMGNYAKLTPVGAGAPGRYDDIQAMGEKGIKLDE